MLEFAFFFAFTSKLLKQPVGSINLDRGSGQTWRKRDICGLVCIATYQSSKLHITYVKNQAKVFHS